MFNLGARLGFQHGIQCEQETVACERLGKQRRNPQGIDDINGSTFPHATDADDPESRSIRFGLTMTIIPP
jgi:hypothetical protein